MFVNRVAAKIGKEAFFEPEILISPLSLLAPKTSNFCIIKYEKKFNQNKTIIPSAKQISKSIKSLDKKVKKAIDLAYSRIYKFHSFQKFKNISYSDKFKNKLEYKYLPIESAAIYVPGSSASYPSSVLMSTIPAIVAGVKRIVMINPSYKGKQNPAVLYAAKKCKIKEIYSIGGPSAIAAAAYGTKKIKKVDKIVGPGNSFVAAAKKEVFGDVGIEGMTAGPSEILIVCDKFSNPEFISTIFLIFTILWVFPFLGFGSPVALIGGFIFGKWIGTIIVTMSLSIGALCLYIFAKFFLYDFLKEKLFTKLKLSNFIKSF